MEEALAGNESYLQHVLAELEEMRDRIERLKVEISQHLWMLHRQRTEVDGNVLPLKVPQRKAG
jgi:hypothetical protein